VEQPSNRRSLRQNAGAAAVDFVTNSRGARTAVDLCRRQTHAALEVYALLRQENQPPRETTPMTCKSLSESIILMYAIRAFESFAERIVDGKADLFRVDSIKEIGSFGAVDGLE